MIAELIDQVIISIVVLPNLDDATAALWRSTVARIDAQHDRFRQKFKLPEALKMLRLYLLGRR